MKAQKSSSPIPSLSHIDKDDCPMLADLACDIQLQAAALNVALDGIRLKENEWSDDDVEVRIAALSLLAADLETNCRRMFKYLSASRQGAEKVA